MNCKNKVYLHVGTHKTGTTSIQHFLVDEKARLAEEGLELFLGRRPKRNGKVDMGGNAWLLADQFLRGGLLTVMRLKHAEKRGFIPDKRHEKDRLRKQILSSPCTEFVVSAESFCLARTESEQSHLKAFFKLIDCDVVPIVYFRNDKSWRDSLSNELVKMKYYGSNVEAITARQRVDGEWYYDLPAILKFWERIGPVQVIDYDKVVLRDGSVIPAFMRALGKNQIQPRKDYFLNVRRS